MGCLALANGGFTGVADDPSAIFYNPAGGLDESSPYRIQKRVGLMNQAPTHRKRGQSPFFEKVDCPLF